MRDYAEVKAEAKRMMDSMIAIEGLDYRNSVVASIIAKGKQDKLNEDWVRKALLSDVEDGFITYAQAVAVKDEYFKAVQTVLKNF